MIATDGNFYIHVGGMAKLFALQQTGKISATSFVVGAALCTFADRDGICWPRREDIGKQIGIARVATISASLSELLQAGFAKRIRLQRGVEYRLHLTPSYTMIAPDVAETATSENSQRSGFRYIGSPDVTESATPEMQFENPDVALSATSIVAETATSLTYYQTNNETNSNNKTRKTRSASQKPKVAMTDDGLAVPPQLRLTWSRAYPGVNLDQEAAKAFAWCVSNPSRAPKKDFTRFLHAWLSRAKPTRDPEEMLDPYAEYEMPQADVDLIVAWEKEKARKAAAHA